MAYDDSKDVMIKSFNMENNGYTLSLKIYSYNNSQPKLQIQRTRLENGSDRFLKLGRLTLDEIKFIKESIDSIIETIEKH